tara:strand:+ start:95 stop:313 length:219 start_codon:yes stop_codon:yes gene_type:complete
MKIISLALILNVLIFFSLSLSVFAHPGNTASDGCHYCRTNCDKWGVAWNTRHCHGRSSFEELYINKKIEIKN